MFFLMRELTTILRINDYTGKPQIALNWIKYSSLVIIDDLMYMAMDPVEAKYLFQLINYLYDAAPSY